MNARLVIAFHGDLRTLSSIQVAKRNCVEYICFVLPRIEGPGLARAAAAAIRKSFSVTHTAIKVS